MSYYFPAQQKPLRWGNFQDVQYSIRKNMERIYKCDPDDEVLVMPLFWGLPVLDFSGHANHGVNHGAQYKDRSLDFDGVNDYVNCGQPYNPTTQLSMSGWVKNKGDGDTTYPRLFGVEAKWILYIRESAHGLSLYGSGIDAVFPNSPTTLDDGNWHFVGMVYDGDGIEGFVDDVSVGVLTKTGNLDDIGAVPFTIASRVAQDRSFNGPIDEVRIANVARTAETIALFHDRPWDLYRRAYRPFYSIASGPPPETSIPIFMNYYRQLRAA